MYAHVMVGSYTVSDNPFLFPTPPLYMLKLNKNEKEVNKLKYEWLEN